MFSEFYISYKIIRLAISFWRRELGKDWLPFQATWEFRKGFPPLQWRGRLRKTLRKNKMEVGRTKQAREYPLLQGERHSVRNGMNSVVERESPSSKIGKCYSLEIIQSLETKCYSKLYVSIKPSQLILLTAQHGKKREERQLPKQLVIKLLLWKNCLWLESY